MPPDEWNYPVNNSVYTNYAAKLALLLPKYVCDLVNCSSPSDYETIANKISIPFDAISMFHPEYDGFTKSMFNVTLSEYRIEYSNIMHDSF